MPTPHRHAPEISAPERALIDGVLGMYRQGWFPMHDAETGQAQWLQPRRRGIIPLDPARFTISRSLRAKVRRQAFLLTTDRAFHQVIRACAQPAAGREETWLSGEIISAFDLLHRAGQAHSIEAWLPPSPTHPLPVLVGGLYGLAIGSVFCGESMFSRPDQGGTDASKVALVHLVAHLRARGFTLLDAQLTNPHLAQFSCYEVSQAKYLTHLNRHAEDVCPWTPFHAGLAPQELSRPA